MPGFEVAPLPSSPVPGDFLDGAKSVISGIEELALRFPDYECLTLLDRNHDEQRISLEAFWSRAKDVQATIEARGLARGDRVLLVLPTGLELLAGYFGVMAAGCLPSVTAVPSNRVSDPSVYLRTVGAILDNAGAKIVYCTDDVATLLQTKGTEVASKATLLRPAEVTPCPNPPPTRHAAPSEIAMIQYSSGTTGTPKGAQVTGGAMLEYLRVLRDGMGLRQDDVNVNWIPMYHDMGLFGAFLLPLLCGSPAVLIPTMDFLRTPVLWLWALHRYRGTVSWAPNFAYSLCTKRIPDAELEGLDLSHVRMAISGSEPLLARTVEEFAERFARHGLRPEAMGGAWGFAEVMMAATVQPAELPPTIETIDRGELASAHRAVPVAGNGLRSVSTGRCLPGFEMQIRDPDGNALPDRGVGEIWLRSRTTFAGYRGDPERSASIMKDGWINSGDRGYRVGEDLFFVSRAKDLIIVGGGNYAPHDIEAVIDRVPGVREGCGVAFGVMSDERGTEELGAVVETYLEDSDEKSALARAIRSEVMSTIGLGIRHLKLVPPGGIEKTTAGKLARAATYQRYASDFRSGA